ncbi:MAG: DUF4331 domain-containing protein [bacterium]|nr:DUF4331 domain-containing protein [bacterium]
MQNSTPYKKTWSLVGGMIVLAVVLIGTLTQASSHREAPLISGDPKADATDLYVFRTPVATTTSSSTSNTVTLIANYLPFEEPAGGPNFYSFDDNVLYEIKIDNNGDAKADVTYQFDFDTTIPNPNTFLYNTGAITSLSDTDFNMPQTYTLTRIKGKSSVVLGTNIPVPPSNVGPKSTPNYAGLQAEAIKTLAGGTKVFAGQSDDPFFVDLGSTFDLLTIRNLPGNAGGGVNTTQGYNVQSLVLQVPITDLTKDGQMPTVASSSNAVIGVWTTSSRPSLKVLRKTEGWNKHDKSNKKVKAGDWVQVSRLGAPLVNEVVIPLANKDTFNASNPVDDAQFANYVADPELAKLLKALYNINVPPQGAFGTPQQRDDLIAIFLTGIPGLTNVGQTKPAELLRLNLAIAPTTTPNKLGVLAGDAQGYPNGRRLSDDVIDISVRAVAGAAYPLFHPGFTPDATGVKLGDGVDGNETSFRSVFPYLALPWSGFESIPHPNAGMTSSSTATTTTI